MMEDDSFESSSSVASQALPTPYDTPYLNQFQGWGRKSPTQTSPALASDEYSLTSNHRDSNRDESRTRRVLTPSLHGQLVSQILDLRRELEAKDVSLDNLESVLDTERRRMEELHTEIRRNTRENKNLKKEIQSIEESTLTALEELCKERDDAKAAAADLKRRLEAYTKELRAEQEHTEQLHQDWQADRSKWALERGTLLRRVDVSESRLRDLISEVSDQHVAGNRDAGEADQENIAPLADDIQLKHASSTRSRTHRRNRSSLSSIASLRHSTEINGFSLADELTQDSGEDEVSEADDSESGFVRDSRPSSFWDPKSRRYVVTGLQTTSTPIEALSRLEGDASDPSETLGGDQTEHAVDHAPDAKIDQSEPVEVEAVEANQRRKRDPPIKRSQTHSRTSSEPLQRIRLDQDQSLEDVQSPLAPLSSPMSIARPTREVMQGPVLEVGSTSTSTQTKPIPEPQIEVPTIAIHPPSRPLSLVQSVLRPTTRHAGCQTEDLEIRSTSDASAQTDIIRVDQRLPAHLKHLSQPPVAVSIEPELEQTVEETETPPAASSFDPMLSTEGGETPFDDLLDQETATTSRWRKLPLFASRMAKQTSSDRTVSHEDAMTGTESSHQSIRVFAGRPRQLRAGVAQFTAVPEDQAVSEAPGSPHRTRPEIGNTVLERQKATHSYTIRPRGSQEQQAGYSGSAVPRLNSLDSMRSSSVWSGTSGPQPPIAIPIRTSSAGLGLKKRKSGQTSPSRRSGTASPTKQGGMRIGKKPLLRSMRSTATDQTGVFDVQPFSPLTQTSFASTDMPPSEVHGPVTSGSQQRGHQRNSSSLTRKATGGHPLGNTSTNDNGQHTVAHALKETMIGEWMWKYTRKRSFGMGNDSSNSSANQVRHKRWIWLSPDERCVMWSSKQPRSDTAWMGKTGRKLQINQVLDVKDDVSHVSRGDAFNQSILIITPSRSLKITAVTKERHYLWLTALSFLAVHPSKDSVDLSYLTRPSEVPDQSDDLLSRTTSSGTASRGTASRLGRAAWSSRNRFSRQTSGYATPSVAEHTTDTNGFAMPPRPDRPPPPAPIEHYLGDTAMGPNIPRVPAKSSSSSLLRFHGRKRSQNDATYDPSHASTRAINSSATSTRGVPTSYSNYSASRQTASGIQSSAASYRPPQPSIPPSRSGPSIETQYNPGTGYTVGFVHNPTTPIREHYPTSGIPQHHEQVPDESIDQPSTTGITNEFGTNTNFFDAAGRRRQYQSRTETKALEPKGSSSRFPSWTARDAGRSQGDARPGPDFEPYPTSGVPVKEEVDVDDRPGSRHANTTSVDSVAPPPILREVAEARVKKGGRRWLF